MKFRNFSLAVIVATALGLEGCASALLKDSDPRTRVVTSGDTTRVYISSYGDELIGITIAYPDSIEINGRKCAVLTQKSVMFDEGFTISVNNLTKEEIKRETQKYRNLLQNRKAYKD